MNLKQNFDQLSSILNEELGVHGNNCKTVIDFTLSLQKARTVNLSQMCNYSNRINEISGNSIYKNYQRLIHNCKIKQADLAKCLIRMFDLSNCKLTLALDRTNWKYGTKDINLLVLSVCLLGCALPLYWVELDKRGNSNTQERTQLLDKFIAEFGHDKIDYLLADREFIGKDWFNYLSDSNIKFVVRIKANMLIEFSGINAKAGKLFKAVKSGDMLTYSVTIEEAKLMLQVTRSKDNELVIVVSNDFATIGLLGVYAKRWRIECLFASIKSKGFNFEDTHITRLDRIGNLTKLIVLAFAICYLIGLVRASITPILIKKHGYKQNSYFRYGMNLMVQKLYSNISQALELIILCLRSIDMEEKVKLLISVMY